MEREVDFGNILRETMALISDTSRAVGIYVLILGGLGAVGILTGATAAAESGFNFDVGFSSEEETPLLTSLFQLVSTIVSLVAGYWLLTCLLAARGRYSGENRFWHYLGMAILSGIGIVIGFVFLIVPGIILAVRWSAASGFVIGARDGVTDSLKASWHATKGHSWPIFFAALALLVGVVLVIGVIAAIFAVAGTTVAAIASAFLEAFASTIALAFGIAVYTLVHDDSRQLGEVFA